MEQSPILFSLASQTETDISSHSKKSLKNHPQHTSWTEYTMASFWYITLITITIGVIAISWTVNTLNKFWLFAMTSMYITIITITIDVIAK